MMRFHHVGIATKEITELKKSLKSTFNITKESEIVFDAEQQAMLCMLEIGNGLNLELIQGKAMEHLVAKGVTYYHLCFSVSDIESELKRLTANTAILVREPKPAVLFNGKKVAFLLTEMGLIELIEENDEDCAAE